MMQDVFICIERVYTVSNNEKTCAATSGTCFQPSFQLQSGYTMARAFDGRVPGSKLEHPCEPIQPMGRLSGICLEPCPACEQINAHPYKTVAGFWTGSETSHRLKQTELIDSVVTHLM